jgi:uncharacterized protein
MLKRAVRLNPKRSYLILGPRRVGKSTYLKNEVRAPVYIDLLKNDVFFDYQSNPSLLRERYAHLSETIVIDEIQRIPELITEVHWLLENTDLRFILSGSSARKLRHRGVGNLAGRLRTQRFTPLIWSECSDHFELDDRLQHGMLPPLLFSDEPRLDLKDYCGEYLREEVQAEGLVRSLPAFTRFLENAALGNAEILSYTTIARECGVSAKTVAEYYQILDDTLLGYFLEPYTKTKRRRSVQSSKFYLFDCGVTNTLLDRSISPKTPEYGKSFEQFLVLETFAAGFYYRNIDRLNFWRSSNGQEVDLLINEHIAVEFKSGRVHPTDAKGILALSEEAPIDTRWIVCREAVPRRINNDVEVLPWQDYLERLPDVR